VTERFANFFEKVLLVEVLSPVVIFVDEIDTTRSLPFAEDFYIAVREMYNARAEKAAFDRLTFVLIGVASPNDLIQDSTRTPFNIAQRVSLTDFTTEEVMPLADGLGLPTDEAQKILKHILMWTGGHPYLTLRLCKLIASKARS